MSSQKLVSHKHNLSRPKINQSQQFSFNEESSLQFLQQQQNIPNLNKENNNFTANQASLNSFDKQNINLSQLQQQHQKYQETAQQSLTHQHNNQQQQQQQSQLSFQLSNYKSTLQDQSLGYLQSNKKQNPEQSGVLQQPFSLRQKQQQAIVSNGCYCSNGAGEGGLPLFNVNEVETMQQVLSFYRDESFNAWLEVSNLLNRMKGCLKNFNKAEILKGQERVLSIFQTEANGKQFFPRQLRHNSALVVEDVKKIQDYIHTYTESGNSQKVWQKLQEHILQVEEGFLKLMFQTMFLSSKARAIARYIRRDEYEAVGDFFLEDNQYQEDFNEGQSKSGCILYATVGKEDAMIGRKQSNKAQTMGNNQIKKKQKKGILIARQEEEDDYFSDFSDEHFEIENEEEKVALNLIALIKEKIEDPVTFRQVEQFDLVADQDVTKLLAAKSCIQKNQIFQQKVTSFEEIPTKEKKGQINDSQNFSSQQKEGCSQNEGNTSLPQRKNLLEYNNAIIEAVTESSEEIIAFVQDSPLLRNFKVLVRNLMQIEASDLEFECLLNRVNFTSNAADVEEEQLRDLLQKIRAKPFSWWKSKLELDKLEINYANFNFQKFNSRRSTRRGGTLGTLVQKLQIFQQAQLHEGSQLLLQFQQNLQQMAGNRDFLSKSEFRKFTLSMEFPLSRKETKILVHLIDDDSHTGKLPILAIKQLLLADPTAILDLSDRLPPFSQEANQQSQMKEVVQKIMSRVRNHISRMCIEETEIRDVFRLIDKTMEGRINNQTFFNCIQECRLPVDCYESELLALYYSTGKEIYQKYASTTTTLTGLVDYVRFLQDLTYYNDNKSDGGETPSSLVAQYAQCNGLLVQCQRNVDEDDTSCYNSAKPLQQHVKGNQIMTYKISQTRLNNLEFENAKLRRQLAENQATQQEIMEERQCLIERIEMLDQKVNLEVNDMQEKNLQFLRENFLHKEMEAYQQLAQVTQRNEMELMLAKKKFDVERNEFRRIIEQKNQEIESYRIELEGILEELEFMRHTQRDNLKNELNLTQNQ